MLVRPRPQRQRIRSQPTKRRGRKKNRSKRKEKRSRRNERGIPQTSVGGASCGARADATKGGGLCGARADTDEAGARVDTIFNCLCYGDACGGLSRDILVAYVGVSTITMYYKQKINNRLSVFSCGSYLSSA